MGRVKWGWGMADQKGRTGQNPAERFKYLLRLLTPKEPRSEVAWRARLTDVFSPVIVFTVLAIVSVFCSHQCSFSLQNFSAHRTTLLTSSKWKLNKLNLFSNKKISISPAVLGVTLELSKAIVKQIALQEQWIWFPPEFLKALRTCLLIG